MGVNFEPFFKEYEALLIKADDIFIRMKKEYPGYVKCKIKCADCCHAVFDLTLVEALYINHHFKKCFIGKKKEDLIEKANRADRGVYLLKRKAYKEFKNGKDENEILMEMAGERIRCPLLSSKEECDLYAHRPLTCRFYGLPTATGGVGHSCGLSGFVKGAQYPTVNLDTIHRKLYGLSQRIIVEIKSSHKKMADILMPLSMALLTVFDEAYLGISDRRKTSDT